MLARTLDGRTAADVGTHRVDGPDALPARAELVRRKPLEPPGGAGRRTGCKPGSLDRWAGEVNGVEARIVCAMPAHELDHAPQLA